MNKNYGININLDLTKEKVKDLKQLVELYSKLGYLKTQFGKVDPNLNVKMGKDIKQASTWVKELKGQLKQLQEQYRQMTGAKGHKLLSDSELGRKAVALRYNSKWEDEHDKILNPHIASYRTGQPITPKTTNEAKKTANATGKIAKD